MSSRWSVCLGIVLLVIVQWRRRQTPAPAGLGVSQEFLARAREEADAASVAATSVVASGG